MLNSVANPKSFAFVSSKMPSYSLKQVCGSPDIQTDSVKVEHRIAAGVRQVARSKLKKWNLNVFIH